MSDIVSPLLQWLNTHPQLAGLFTFLISAGESVAIIGTIVPGSIMMTAIGTLAGAGIIPFWETIFWAIIGAIVGDGISYWIGHHFKDRLPSIWPFHHYPSLLRTGEVFFHKYGVMSVFIGRFVGPVRALVPLVAGMLGMRPLVFLIANVTSAIGWAPAYMLPGLLLGAASLELPPDIALHVILVLTLIFLFILLCLWFIYKLLQLIHHQTDQLQNAIWIRLTQSRQLKSITVLLKHHNEVKTHGQLTLAFYFIIASILFLSLALYVKFKSAGNIVVNQTIFHLFRGIRNPHVDHYMLNITLLGQKEVILPVVFVVFAWLVISKRWRAAFHALALGILAAGSVFIFKHIFKSIRPWGILHSPETFSMPSGHAVLSATLFLGLAFLISCSISPKRRWLVYNFAILMTLIVGISRLYLGAHWFTDILSSWLLSTALLLVVIISFRRQMEKPLNPFGLIFITLIALSLTFGTFHYRHFAELNRNYAPVNWPIFTVSIDDWWQKNLDLPAYRTSLFGFPSYAINLEWVGNLEQIRKTLMAEGWQNPPARDFVSTLHRISDIKSAEYLPMVSPQYLDHVPALTLTRKVDGRKNLFVLRLWDANRTIKETNNKLWVGFVGIVPRSYNWLFKSHPSTINIDPTLVFSKQPAIKLWQWKVILITPPDSAEKKVQHEIMLIRPSLSSSY